MTSLKTLAVAFAVCAAAQIASAIEYSFSAISNNSGQADAVAGQFSVDVTEAAGTVSFRFTNVGSIASSITRIYFDSLIAEVITGTSSIASSGGVSFQWGSAPPNLPGGNTIDFSADYSASAKAPVSPNGIANLIGLGTGEWLTLTLKTAGGVLGALDSGDLRIGLHVQSIGTSGQSDAFVTRVPDTSLTLILFGAALAALGGYRRFVARG